VQFRLGPSRQTHVLESNNRRHVPVEQHLRGQPGPDPALPHRPHRKASHQVSAQNTNTDIYFFIRNERAHYLEIKLFRALWINCIGLIVLLVVCCWGGLVMYAKYADCDPLAAGVSLSFGILIVHSALI
jgi:hypothetical protein